MQTRQPARVDNIYLHASHRGEGLRAPPQSAVPLKPELVTLENASPSLLQLLNTPPPLLPRTS
ncbi:conserved protein of unknown function [Pseudomonas marincola]|uniref:Uncharacterized protein n=1 Tax=Pseudomonas marincola TaxID=437900 RepID=A0A653DXR1_9PSED|nr:conserved protein of unknown function [Pseudomonas marincola]